MAEGTLPCRAVPAQCFSTALSAWGWQECKWVSDYIFEILKNSFSKLLGCRFLALICGNTPFKNLHLGIQSGNIAWGKTVTYV
jgi:hypothetical protein